MKMTLSRALCKSNRLTRLIDSKALSTEKPIILNYTHYLPKPVPSNKCECEDWIRVISTHRDLETFKPSIVAVGLFNGGVSIHNDKLEPQTNIKPHLQSITDIKFIGNEGSFVTSSLDQTISIYDKGGEKTLTSQLPCRVYSLAVNPIDQNLFCAGGSDGSIYVFDEKESDDSLPISHKKKKVEIKSSKPIKSIKAHNFQISALQYISQFQVLSGSYDHSIKISDIESGEIVSSYTTSYKTVTAFDHKSGNVVSGHEDGSIMLWDLKSPNTTHKMESHLHTNRISCIEFNPLNPFIYLSTSYDNTAKLWDIRSDQPFHSINSEKELFTGCWNGAQCILIGGKGKEVKQYVLPFHE